MSEAKKEVSRVASRVMWMYPLDEFKSNFCVTIGYCCIEVFLVEN